MIPSPSTHHPRPCQAHTLKRALALFSATPLAAGAASLALASPIALADRSGDAGPEAGPPGQDQVLGVMEQTRAILAGDVDRAEAAVQSAFQEPTPDGGMGPRTPHGWRVFGGPNVEADRKISTGATDAGLDATAWGGSVGVDWLATHRLLVGLQVAQSHVSGKFDAGGGSYAGDMTLVTLLTTYRFSDSFSTQSSTSFGAANYGRIARRSVFQSGAISPADDQASGSTVGTYESSRSSLDYARTVGRWSVTGSARLSYDRNWLRGYDESPGPLSLVYGDAAIADYQAGARIRAERLAPVWGMRPFVEVEYDHALGGGDYHLDAGPTRGQIAAFAVAKPYDSAASVLFGAAWRVGRGLQFGAVLNNRAEFGARSEHLSGGTVFLSSRF